MMRSVYLISALGALGLLAACGSREDPDKGSSLNVTVTGDTDDVGIRADGETGKVALKLPGFEARLNLPTTLLKDDNFDLDGVKLYPGSTVSAVDIAADERGKDQATVTIGFDAPGEPAKVGTWFRERFAEKSVTLTGSDASQSGTTSDGDRFTIDLAAVGSGSKGTIRVFN